MDADPVKKLTYDPEEKVDVGPSNRRRLGSGSGRRRYGTARTAPFYFGPSCRHPPGHCSALPPRRFRAARTCSPKPSHSPQPGCLTRPPSGSGLREVRKFPDEEKLVWKVISSTGLCYGRTSQAAAVTRVLSNCFLSWRQKEFSSPTQKQIRRLMF